MKVKIPLKGITTTPVYEDGDMISLVNLRNKAGALEPVPPKELLMALDMAYNLVVVHQLPDGSRKWICVEAYDIWVVTTSGKTKIGAVEDPIVSIEQMGNLLTFITISRMYYALYDGVEYDYLGSIPELPQINILTTGVSNKTSEYPAGTGSENFQERSIAQLNVALQKCYTDDGIALSDAHFLMIAFKLYDGTYIKHSSPVLILPPYNIFSGLKLEYTNNNTITTGLVRARTYKINFQKIRRVRPVGWVPRVGSMENNYQIN